MTPIYNKVPIASQAESDARKLFSCSRHFVLDKQKRPRVEWSQSLLATMEEKGDRMNYLQRYTKFLGQSGQIERVDRGDVTFAADLIFVVFTLTMLTIALAGLFW